LSTVIPNTSACGTPTTEAKTIVDLVLSLRVTYGVGLLPEYLSANNDILDENQVIEIRDFSKHNVARLEGHQE
jgi:hypothetical protein